MTNAVGSDNFMYQQICFVRHGNSKVKLYLRLIASVNRDDSKIELRKLNQN